MEYKLASEGRVQELREWLRQHPERVNVPKTPENFTLLYCALMGLQHMDLSARSEGRPNKFDETIKMLVTEFHADVDAPNGGMGLTAVHCAVRMGDERVLALLVHEGRSRMARSAFYETPLQLCERERPGSVCLDILRRAVEQREGPRVPGPHPEDGRAGEQIDVAQLRQKILELRIADSDSDSVDGDGTNSAVATTGAVGAAVQTSLDVPATPRADAAMNARSPPLLASPLPPPSRSLRVPLGSTLSCASASSSVAGMSRASPGGSGGGGSMDGLPRPPQRPPPRWRWGSHASAASAVPARAPARAETVMTDLRPFENVELEQFRRHYGNGFDYVRCADHYEISGLIPYKFKGREYFAPLIFSVYAPSPAGADGFVGAAAGAVVEGAGAGASSVKPAYSRYRAVVDERRLQGFMVSRRAEYLDPVSLAIMPSPSDAVLCRSLLDFVQTSVVENFQRVAPMMDGVSAYAFPPLSLALIGSSSDNYRHHHSSSNPAYMRNVLRSRDARRLWAFRVLQELSRFGDGLFDFSPVERTALGCIPLYTFADTGREAIVFVDATRSNGSTAATARPAPPSSSSPQPFTSTGELDHRPTARVKPIDVFVGFAVRVLITFSPPTPADADAEEVYYPSPPQLYLWDCADPRTQGTVMWGPPRHFAKANFLCFEELLADRATGRVRDEVLQPALDEWAAVEQSATARERRPARPPSATSKVERQGTLFAMLLALQRRATAALERFSASYEMSLSASGASAALMPVSGAVTTITTTTTTTTTVAASSSVSTHGSPLDTLFAGSPTTSPVFPQSDSPLPSPMGSGGSGSTASGPNCVLCLREPKRIVLQPCRHACLCTTCAWQLRNHARGCVFPCPVCRREVKEVQEIYL